jgi:hypothetical protein
MTENLPVMNGKEPDRLIACALFSEPMASAGRVWRLVPENARPHQRRAQGAHQNAAGASAQSARLARNFERGIGHGRS